MAKILPFSPPNFSFDPEAAAILVAAYDKATHELGGKGQPQIVRELIAKRIIVLAAKGERDSDRLCADALTSLGLPK